MNRRPGSTLVVSVLVILGYSACASPRASLGTYSDEADGGAAPRFQEAADASADGAPAAAETSMCPSDECAEPYATCPSSRHICATRLDDDPLNCGSCGNACPAGTWMTGELNGASWSCLSGRCEMTCTNLRYADCNGYVEDGCETALGSNANCRFCGEACPLGYECQVAPQAILGCVTRTCNSPLVMCGDICTDINKDNRNCGECGYDCGVREPLPPNTVRPPYMVYTCVAGRCNVLKCQQNYANCNQIIDDGCEVDLRNDPLNCGACNVVCGAGEICLNGACVCRDPCSCGGNDYDSNPNQCGSCNHVCPGVDAVMPGRKPPKGHRTCRGGQCGYACDEGWANCNGDVLDGCEIDVRSDPRNCGSCGHSCLSNQACANGVCATKPCSSGAPQ